jgi:hypothetical protein
MKKLNTGGTAMRGRLKVRVEHYFQPDPDAVLRAIAALIKCSDERRALDLGVEASSGGA